MKSWSWKEMLAAAIILPALSGAVWAGGSDDLGCSNATLKGDYAFAVLTIVAASPPDQALWSVSVRLMAGAVSHR
jgi:hypothetical protein